MRKPCPALSTLAAMVLASAATCAACTSASNERASSGTGTPAATATTDPPPKIPPKGDPADPAPLDATDESYAKACTPNPTGLYALSAKKLTVGNDVPLCRFEGNVLLIVNVASHCGNTPQYAPLQALYAKYRAQGLYVLGFPSPQFGGQEFANETDVTAFCTSTYHITFPMFSIGDVNGPNKQPVYSWIHAQPGGPAPDGYARDVQWNFEKYLIDRHGKLVQRIENGTAPDAAEVVTAIEAELAKP